MLRQRGHSDGRAREEFDRLIEAARTTRTSPYLVEKIVLAAYTGLRRGSLFNLKWDQIDFANRVMLDPPPAPTPEGNKSKRATCRSKRSGCDRSA